MKKKIIWLLVLMILAVLTACTRSQQQSNWQTAADINANDIGNLDYQQKYDSEEDFNWQFYHDGVAIIGYKGWTKYVEIPPMIQGKPVIRIGERAFLDEQLESVTIPSCVVSIGTYAFLRNKLTSVIIPDSVTSIEGLAFSQNLLTRVFIPDSVTNIGVRAFEANQLVSVNIPNNITIIEDGVFENNRITDITIPEGVTFIGSEAFMINQITSIIIPASVTEIGFGAFAFNKLTNVVIPNSVTSIESSTFWDNQLTSITIPDSVTSIRVAFIGNPLTSISIGNNVSFSYSIPMVGDDDTGGFDPQFARFYQDNERKAGIYTYNNDSWSVQFR